MVLGLEPLLEAIHAALHLRGDLAGRLVHGWPSSACEHLNTEVKGEWIARAQVLTELGLHVLRQLHVLKHLSHAVHLVGAALDLQLLNEELFVLGRNTRLVQQSRGQLLHGLLQECVSTIQASEQVNDG